MANHQNFILISQAAVDYSEKEIAFTRPRVMFTQNYAATSASRIRRYATSRGCSAALSTELIMVYALSDRIRNSTIEAAKKIAFQYTSLAAPRYSYCVEPIQLTTLINEIERLKPVRGCIVEIGVARGMTTRFLAEHLVRNKISDTTIYAIDTFSSFIEKDLQHEVRVRGKSLTALKRFSYNDYETWAKNFFEFSFVRPIKTDCAAYDYSELAPIKLAFLDVDLYIPTKMTLPKIYENMVEGGVILVDDVLNNRTYDGAYQAYMEYCEEKNIAPVFIGNKCGIIRK
jgi:O-methyltransferase